MGVWLVRAGAHGEAEQVALDENVVVVGWPELGDLTSVVGNWDGLLARIRETYPDASAARVSNWGGQLNGFLTMAIGDLAVLPLKTRSALAIGKITGAYTFRPSAPLAARHAREVQWLTKDLPRTSLRKDLLHSLGAFMTVCRITRNGAEARIRGVLEGKPDIEAVAGGGAVVVTDETASSSAPRDLEQEGRDEILSYLSRNFRGQALVRVVAGILRAHGYYVDEGPEAGPDAGVDAIAGGGPLGFDAPRIAVQVKSGDTPVGSQTLNELRGAMQSFGADQGLLVSWGGFNSGAIKEARRLGF